jgi:fumarate reductase subunit D
VCVCVCGGRGDETRVPPFAHFWHSFFSLNPFSSTCHSISLSLSLSLSLPLSVTPTSRCLIIFIGGARRDGVDEIRCFITAVLLHFFLLVTFSWLLCQALHIRLHAGMTLPFNTHSSNCFWRFFAFCWIFPLAVVFVAAVAARSTYYNDDYCWIDPSSSLAIAFVMPAAVLIVLTAFCYLIVLLRLYVARDAESVEWPGIAFVIYGLIVIVCWLATSLASSPTFDKEVAFVILCCVVTVSKAERERERERESGGGGGCVCVGALWLRLWL